MHTLPRELPETPNPISLPRASGLVAGTDVAANAANSSANATTPSLRDRLLRGGLWVLFGRVAGISSIVLMNALLARGLTLDDFGAFVVAKSLASIFGLAAMLGWNSSLLRFLAERLALGDARGARWYLILSCVSVLIASSTLLFVLAGTPVGAALGHWLKLPNPNSIVVLAGLWMFVSAWHSFLAEGLRGCHEQRFATLLGGEMGGPLANLLFCVALVATMPYVTLSLELCLKMCVVIQTLLLPLTAGLMVWTLRRRGAEFPKTSESEFVAPSVGKILFAVCIPMVAVNLLSWVIGQGDVWIAGTTCSPEDLALYAAARRLMLIVMTPLLLANLASLPAIAELLAQRKHVELQQLLQRTATLAGIPSLLATACLIFFPTVVLDLVFGAKFQAAAPLTVLLAAGQLVFVLTGAWTCALNMAGRHSETLWINITTVVIILAAGPWGAREYGAWGLALVMTFAIVVQNFLGLYRTKQVLGVWCHASFACLPELFHAARGSLTNDRILLDHPELAIAIDEAADGMSYDTVQS
jgi:O-antigen/teichoic acid export membrane protein